MKLIVIDDEPIVLQSLNAALNALGHECVAFSSWREAQPTFENADCDAVLTDLNMSEINGYDVLAYIRSLPQGSEVKVAAVTGDVGFTTLARINDAGFDAHVKKPYSLLALSEMLKQFS